MKKVVARFWATKAGNEPVRDFLLELFDADRKIVGQDIARVEFGWPIGLPVCDGLSDGLYEVRSSISSNRIVRVYFGFDDNEIVLAHGVVTNRSQLDRLLDPTNDAVQLDTIAKAATILGKRVRIELVDHAAGTEGRSKAA